MIEINGQTLCRAMISGANSIQNNRSDVDELNVFPVPDGDTGTNMSMTITAASRELENLAEDSSVEEVAKTAASAMLRGARGNSGVILSLLFRGFSKALVGEATMNSEKLKAALASGVSAAYKAVMKPTEGTMLTVARVASERIASSEISDIDKLFSAMCQFAEEALEETPEQLPVLKKAGVVDAGGKGLIFIFEGMRQVISGEGFCMPEQKEHKSASSVVGKGVFAEELFEESDFGYCTEFIINKESSASTEKLSAFLGTIGDSIVVVEDESIIKVHVHTDDPGRVLTHAIGHGNLTKIKIENMSEQYESRQQQGKGLVKQVKSEMDETATFKYAAVDPEIEYGFVAVSAGEGLKNLFSEFGVDAIVTGGQTMNPSTDDILGAAHSVPAKNVFILPNNKNIILAAEQAKKLADRNLIVLPTRSIPQGISALLCFDPEAGIEQNATEMIMAAEAVSTGQITFAARDSDFDGHKIKKNEILALENGKLTHTGTDVTQTLIKLVKGMVKKNSSFFTLIAGADISQETANETFKTIADKLPKNIESSLVMGGQPVYYYIVSIE